MKSNDPTNFTVPRDLEKWEFCKMSFQYFSIKYEIVSGSLLSFFSLCKESKKREAIKKRKPGNVASTASKQGSSAAVLLKLVHKKSLTQCLKEMLASK